MNKKVRPLKTKRIFFLEKLSLNHLVNSEGFLRKTNIEIKEIKKSNTKKSDILKNTY